MRSASASVSTSTLSGPTMGLASRVVHRNAQRLIASGFPVGRTHTATWCGMSPSVVPRRRQACRAPHLCRMGHNTLELSRRGPLLRSIRSPEPGSIRQTRQIRHCSSIPTCPRLAESSDASLTAQIPPPGTRSATDPTVWVRRKPMPMPLGCGHLSRGRSGPRHRHGEPNKGRTLEPTEWTPRRRRRCSEQLWRTWPGQATGRIAHVL